MTICLLLVTVRSRQGLSFDDEEPEPCAFASERNLGADPGSLAPRGFYL